MDVAIKKDSAAVHSDALSFATRSAVAGPPFITSSIAAFAVGNSFTSNVEGLFRKFTNALDRLLRELKKQVTSLASHVLCCWRWHSF